MNYAVDRQLIIQTVLHGVGQPAWSLWPSGTPYYDATHANLYAYDPTKAKQLLTAAGYPDGFNASMIFVVPSSTVQQIFQVLQQEWKAIGIHLTLAPSTNGVTDFYVRHSAPLGLAQGSGGVGTYGILNPYVPGFIGDACNYNDPTISALYNTLRGVDPASPQGIALLHQIENVVYQQALQVFISTSPVVVGYDSKVRNLVVNSYYYSGFPVVLDYWSGLGISK
jgi:ABC-type transport system substrate-binding protein